MHKGRAKNAALNHKPSPDWPLVPIKPAELWFDDRCFAGDELCIAPKQDEILKAQADARHRAVQDGVDSVLTTIGELRIIDAQSAIADRAGEI
jgi:hypothetical protein